MRTSTRVALKRHIAHGFIFTFLLFCHAAAQSPKDSIDLLIVLAQEKLKTDYAASEADAVKAYNLSSRENYTVGKAKAKLITGKALYFLNKPQEALQAFTEAESLFLSLGDSIHTGLALNGMGTVYLQKLDRIVTAHEYYTKAALFLRGDSSALMLTLNNIGTVQNRTGNYGAALNTYKVVLGIAQRTNNAAMMGTMLHNIATVHNRQQNYEQSIVYMEKALAVAEAQHDSRKVSNALNNMALAYKELKRMPEARELVTRAIAIAEASEHPDEWVYALINLSDIHLRSGELANAERVALEAQRVAAVKGVTFLNKYLYDHLSRVYEATGAFEKALHFKDKLAGLTDSIAREERKAVVQASTTVSTTSSEPVDNGSGITYWQAFSIVAFSIIGFVLLILRKKNTAGVKLDSARGNDDDRTETPLEDREPDQHDSKEAHRSERTKRTDVETHLEVQSGEGLKLLNLDNISWFQKEGNAYYACASGHSGQHYRIRQNINALEELLPDAKFFRINRAVIVNMEKISNYSFWENHKYIIRMEGEPRTEFTITRTRLRELKEKFNLVEKV